MNPYRQSQKPKAVIVLGSRWNVPSWKKWYVRIVRIFLNLRSRYEEAREYKQYERSLKRWHVEYEEYKKQFFKTEDEKVAYFKRASISEIRKFHTFPPPPCAPPVRIME